VVAGDQPDPARRAGRGRAQEGSAGGRRDPGELLRGPLGERGVAGGESDLDGGCQQRSRPRHVRRTLVERTPNHRDAGRDVALGDSEEGETGLWAAAPSACLSIRGLRGVVVTTQPKQLRLLVVGLADCRLRRWPRQPFLGPPCLGRSLRPCAMEAFELSPEHETAPAERDEVRLRLAPACQRVGPELRSAQVEDLVERLDRCAVDDPDDDRPDLAGCDREHGLIEEGDTLGHLAKADQASAAPESRHRCEVPVSESLRNGRGFSEGRIGRGRIARVERLERPGHEHEAPLDAVDAGLVDQACRARQPAARDGEITPLEDHHSEPERVSRRTIDA
jgi:hypothetical protein